MKAKFTHKNAGLSAIIDTTHSEDTEVIKVTGDPPVVRSLFETLNLNRIPGGMDDTPEELRPYVSEDGLLMKWKDDYLRKIFIPSFSDIYEIEILEN